jgi:flagellar basal body rod protein FlgB
MTNTLLSGRFLTSTTRDNKTPAGANGNNVNLEMETASAKENRLMFELYASIFQNRMELIQSAITQSR